MITTYQSDFEATEIKAQPVAVFKGESIRLCAKILNQGVPVSLSDYSAQCYYQPISSIGNPDAGFYSCPATISNDIAYIDFGNAQENDSDGYRLFLRLDLNGEVSYPAYWDLKLVPSPGFTPSELPLPVKTIDFNVVSVLNPPWEEPWGQINPIVRDHLSNDEIHVTSVEKTKWNNKADISAIPVVDQEFHHDSPNPVASKVIQAALNGKQDTLGFDLEPTQRSYNVVFSDGIYNWSKQQFVPMGGTESGAALTGRIGWVDGNAFYRFNSYGQQMNINLPSAAGTLARLEDLSSKQNAITANGILSSNGTGTIVGIDMPGGGGGDYLPLSGGTLSGNLEVKGTYSRFLVENTTFGDVTLSNSLGNMVFEAPNRIKWIDGNHDAYSQVALPVTDGQQYHELALKSDLEDASHYVYADIASNQLSDNVINHAPYIFGTTATFILPPALTGNKVRDFMVDVYNINQDAITVAFSGNASYYSAQKASTVFAPVGSMARTVWRFTEIYSNAFMVTRQDLSYIAQ